MVELTRFLRSQDIFLDVPAPDKAAVLGHAANVLGDALPAGAIEALLVAREKVASTGVGEGVAIPHASTTLITAPRVALLRMARPVPFDAVDDLPVALVFAVLAPADAQALHLRLLARVARLVRSPEVRSALLAAKTSQEAYGVILEATGTPPRPERTELE